MGLLVHILRIALVCYLGPWESLEKPPGIHLLLDPASWLELAIGRKGPVAQKHSC